MPDIADSGQTAYWEQSDLGQHCLLGPICRIFMVVVMVSVYGYISMLFCHLRVYIFTKGNNFRVRN